VNAASVAADVAAPVRLHTSARPDVSIVIPTSLRRDLLFECLASIAARAEPAIQHEVIVVVNGSDAEAARVRDRVSGATVRCMGSNVGFAAACNEGARHASGRWIALLNDDTRIGAGWLSALVSTFVSRPGIGAVGSRMLFADGRLQEAGSIVWADGSTLGLGRHEPGASRGRAQRATYCSACSLLVARSTWVALGGLDEGYHPAYYEDVDFCLRLAARGLDVVYAPDAVVEHHEAASSDPDYRLFLFAWNKQRFTRKWRGALRGFEPARPDAPERAEWLAAGAPRRLLIVDDTWPDGSAGSGLPRMRDTIGELADDGWAIDLWTAAPATAHPAGARYRQVSGALDAWLAAPDRSYDAIILSRPTNFDAWHARVRARQPQAALVYDGEALFHVRLERQAALASGAERAAAARAADEMRALESRIRAGVDAIVCVSTTEAEFLARTPGHAPVHLMLPLVSGARATGRPFATRHGAALVAGWLGGEQSPNTDAFHWFRREVLPLVRQAVPGFQLFVTGRYPPASVVREAGEEVVLLGAVDDLHDVYDRVRTVVVPTRIGAGVKNKFVEALQYGVPVVATPVGTEGVDGWTGAARVTGTAEAFAAAVVDLCTNESAWLAARRAAAAAVGRWQAAARGWAGLLDGVHAARARACAVGAGGRP
jgi:GT2 family glycosyltransferase